MLTGASIKFGRRLQRSLRCRLRRSRANEIITAPRRREPASKKEQSAGLPFPRWRRGVAAKRAFKEIVKPFDDQHESGGRHCKLQRADEKAPGENGAEPRCGEKIQSGKGHSGIPIELLIFCDRKDLHTRTPASRCRTAAKSKTKAVRSARKSHSFVAPPQLRS